MTTKDDFRKEIWDGWQIVAEKFKDLNWLVQNEYPYNALEFDLWCKELVKAKEMLTAMESNTVNYIEMIREEN